MSLVLVDRDGTLNRLVRGGYVTRPEDLEILDGALEALRMLHDAGLKVAVVTNQSCIGRGLVTPEAIARVHARLAEEILAHGGLVQAIYCCPHAPQDDCECRKPRPGLLRRALRDAGTEPEDAVLIGDAPADMEAARNAGMRAVQVLTGYGADAPPGDIPAAVLPDVRAAAQWIVDQWTR